MNDQNFNEDSSSQTTMGKVMTTSLKIDGWDYRAKMLKNMVVGILLILGGLYIIYTYFTNPTSQVGTLEIGSVLILMGVLAILGAWFYWWRSKSLVRGKFYIPGKDMQ
jgi:uncharacterized membrane protein YidH (DUF202 family)